MKLLVLLALLGCALAQDCPAWRPFSDWTGCVWPEKDGKMSVRPMMKSFLSACKIDLKGAKMEDFPDITDKYDIAMPKACGHCSFKVRCKNRERKDGCFPIEAEKETCHNHADVCDMPKTPGFNNCRWNMMGAYLSQCVTNRADIAEWRREGYSRGGKFFPEQNCVEEGSGCKCCCHPYRPVKGADGAYTCEQVPHVDKNAACEAWGEYGEWSKCMWYPLNKMKDDLIEHCGLKGMLPPQKPDPKKEAGMKKLMKSLNIEGLEKCGHCSFRVRCRKRKGGKACFPFEADKKNCGPTDDGCENCGNVCTLPKIPEAASTDNGGTCDWHKFLLEILKKRAGKYMVALKKQYWKKRGFFQMLKLLPSGKCVEKDGKCKCCCHPYKPNDEGTECVLRDMCKLPEDMTPKIEWDTKP